MTKVKVIEAEGKIGLQPLGLITEFEDKVNQATKNLNVKDIKFSTYMVTSAGTATSRHFVAMIIYE